MSAEKKDKKTLWVRIPVEVPKDCEIDVTDYVYKFLDDGWRNLCRNINDGYGNTTEIDEVFAFECEFGEIVLEDRG